MHSQVCVKRYSSVTPTKMGGFPGRPTRVGCRREPKRFSCRQLHSTGWLAVASPGHRSRRHGTAATGRRNVHRSDRHRDPDDGKCTREGHRSLAGSGQAPRFARDDAPMEERVPNSSAAPRLRASPFRIPAQRCWLRGTAHGKPGRALNKAEGASGRPASRPRRREVHRRRSQIPSLARGRLLARG